MRSEHDRFIEKVEQVPEAGCWLWMGATYRKGYGHFRRKVNGKWKMYKCHRYSYEHFVGPIPDGLSVLHRCDVPSCVNPNHLFVGTLGDNNRDTIAKGRKVLGRNPKHKHLSKELADEIREGWFEERMKLNGSQKEYAEAYGISPQQMSRILNNQIWK